MPEYDNTNRGVMFKHTPKTPNDKAPVMKGKLNVDGVEKEISAWSKIDKNGNKYLSLQVQEPFKASQTTDAPPMDDDENPLPF